MSDPRPTLLLTRPLATSRRFADGFRARFGQDWPIVLCPLMETQHLSPDLPDKPFAHVAFTSETAVAAYARLSGDRTPIAWCVGQRTALAARTAGFPVRQGPGDAEALMNLIRAERPAGAFLWPRGAQIARDLASELRAAGFEITGLQVYTQRAADPTAGAMALLAGDRPLLLPLFSPRSARLAADAFGAHAAPIRVAALSPAVADAAGRLAPERLSIAGKPESESLLDALAALI